MKEDRRWSSSAIWKISGGVAPHQLGQKDIPEVSSVSFNGVIRDWEIIPVNRDEPMGSEVGFPLILDCGLHHLPEGFGSGVNLTEFPIEGLLVVLMGF